MSGRTVRLLIALSLASMTTGRAQSPVEQAYLKASNAESGDFFGGAVAVSGDTLVVGAAFESGDASSKLETSNNNTIGAGAVYVYVRNGTGWEQQAYLKASNPGEFDLFGGVVAISGDTIVVGAATESGDVSSTPQSPNDNADAAGAAYVFERTGSTWNQTAYLKATNTGPRDLFGVSVAISGDTIAVGASAEDGNSASTAASPNDFTEDAGAVYVFERDGGGWIQSAYLKASNASEEDSFGHSIAICGDHLISGAWAERGNASSSTSNPNDLTPFAGAAYIFERNPIGGTWSQAAYLKASNTEADDQFGIAVAISGDVAVVGAVFEDGDASSTADAPNNLSENAGAVYVFERGESAWSQTGYVKADPTGAHYGFGGFGLAIEGGTIVVGSMGEDPLPNTNSPSGRGAAYVFDRFGSIWSQRARIEASNGDGNEIDGEGLVNPIGDQFGAVIAISGSHIVIGAAAEAGDANSTAAASNNDAPCAGAAYVFLQRAPGISSVTRSPGGVRLEIPFPCQSNIGVEYSPDLSAGSWLEIGEFLDAESDGIGTFIDSDPSRQSRGDGFYRGVRK